MKKSIALIMVLVMVLISTMSFAIVNAEISQPTAKSVYRSDDFNDGSLGSGGVWYMDPITAGGTITEENGMNNLIRSGNDGLLQAEYWLNGSYELSDNCFVQFTLTKSTQNINAKFMVTPCEYVTAEWRADGKLYVAYREISESTDINVAWKQVGDINGLTAQFFILFDVTKSSFYMWVNGELMINNGYSKAVYNGTHGTPSFAHSLRIFTETGSKNETLSVDNIVTGKANVPLLTGGITYRALDQNGQPAITTLARGGIQATVDFIGVDQNNFSDIYVAALYKKGSNEVTDLKIINPNELVTGTDGRGSLTAQISVPYDFRNYYIKSFVWNGIVTMNPVSTPRIASAEDNLPVPAIQSVYRSDDFNDGSLGSGSLWYMDPITDGGTITEENGMNNLIRSGNDGLLQAEYYLNGSYGLSDINFIKFTLKKSSQNMRVNLTVTPGYYVSAYWDTDGKLYAAYREDPNDTNTDLEYKSVGAIDGLTANFFIYLDTANSSYSLWVNDKLLLEDVYSKAVYEGQHSVPNYANTLRIFTETGLAGDTVSVDEAYTGVPVH